MWQLLGFGWGMCDGTVNPIVNGILANDFTEKAEVFGVYTFIKGFSIALGFALAGYLFI